MRKKREDMAGFQRWLAETICVGRATGYNYASRVRGILLQTGDELSEEGLHDAIEGLSGDGGTKTLYRTSWKHYADYMLAQHGKDLPRPRNLREQHAAILRPVAVLDAIQKLVDESFVTPKVLSAVRWKHFDRSARNGVWRMRNPEVHYEWFNCPTQPVMALFEWSSSEQPEDETPMVAVAPDSLSAVSARGITNLLLRHRRSQKKSGT